MGKQNAGGHWSLAFVQRLSTGWSRLLAEVSLFLFKWVLKYQFYFVYVSYLYTCRENVGQLFCRTHDSIWFDSVHWMY